MTSSDRGSAADEPRSRNRLPLRKRALLVLGSLLALGATLVSAGFVDDEYAAGAVSTGTYNLLISSDGVNFDDTTPAAPLPGTLTPGGNPASTTIWVKNDGTYWSDLNVRLWRQSGSSLPLLNAMDYTVAAVPGSSADLSWSEIGVDNPLDEGGYLLPNLIAPGATVKITITVSLPDDVTGVDDKATARLIAVFLGESVATPAS